MAKVIESISTINSVLRTVLGFVLVGGVTAAAYMGYSTWSSSKNQAAQNAAALEEANNNLKLANESLRKARTKIDELGQKVEEQAKEIDRLATSLRLLKVDHRVAKLNVIDQTQDEETGIYRSKIEFVEVDDQGRTIGEPRVFDLQGQIIYVDGWIVKFDDKYIEEADIERGTSLVLFRRLFGEYQQPSEGFTLDKAKEAPLAYTRSGKQSDLEKKIWADFWSIANDSTKARELGIRAAHGDAPSIKMRKGMSYRIELRASGGLTIKPIGPIDDVPTT